MFVVWYIRVCFLYSFLFVVFGLVFSFFFQFFLVFFSFPPPSLPSFLFRADTNIILFISLCVCVLFLLVLVCVCVCVFFFLCSRVCVFRKTDVYAEAMGAPVAEEAEDGAASSSSSTFGRAPQKWSARGKGGVQHPLPVNAVRA